MKKAKTLLRHFGIGVPEYACKISAIPGAAVAVGTEGGFLEQTARGIYKSFTAIPDAISGAKSMYTFADDFTQKTTSDFFQKYGPEAVEQLEQGTSYIGQVADNLQSQPLGSALAGLAAAGILYGAGKALQFVRQKGQGSYLTQISRKYGDKIWGKKE